jgi:sulfate adenylyltransferase subunit 1 (EFTu-like GTPase family)
LRPQLEVPISARRGDNVVERSDDMPWYKGPTLLEALDTFRKIPPPTEKPLRFPVQDVYPWGGPEADHIAAGRVESGRLRAGQRLRFVPGEQLRTVRAIKQYAEPDLAEAEAGQCVGVILDEDGPRRGQVGCPADDMVRAARRFHASVFWLARVPLEVGGSHPRALTIKCATQEQPCCVAALDERIDSSTLERLPAEENRLQETEVGEVVIETAEPIVVESFYDVQELGRFVLVRGRDVVAGGIVTRAEG